MDLGLREEPVGSLVGHADISIAFVVDTIAEVSLAQVGRGGSTLDVRAIDVPYAKDYDAIKGEGARGGRRDSTSRRGG